ncbi:MAG: hypothetical protein J6C46_10755 [Clostridia bacterium]|nr:hypothetical protein [Clostridia bacterium]
MHINNGIINKIVAMLMCILLLSNLGLSVVLASSSNMVEGSPALLEFECDSGIIYDVNKNGKMVIELGIDDDNAIYAPPSYIKMTPKETGVYTLTVTGALGTATDVRELRYRLLNNNGGVVRLAARYSSNQFSIITQDTSESSTTIDVILTEGQEYYIEVQNKESVLSEVTVIAEKRNIMQLAMAVTNIPSSAVSNNNLEDTTYIEDAGNYKVVEFDFNEMTEYLDAGSGVLEKSDEVSTGGFLESILANIVLAIGSVFLNLLELVIKPNVSLTIDNILFNRFEQTVIDLTPLGGINVGAGLASSGKGIFYDSKVGEIIGILFNALKNLSIMIYIVMLLYIGVKILLSVGGKDQQKYIKYLEYWVTGILFLVIIPYFLPAIPAATNAIVGMMEEYAQSMSGTYSTAEILERLGQDASLLGEDAEIVQLKNLINERIEQLNTQIQGTPQTRDAAQKGINAKIDELLASNTKYSEAIKTDLRTKINSVIGIIDANYDKWTSDVEKEYNSAVEDVFEWMIKNSEKGKEVIANSNIPEEVKNSDYYLRMYINTVFNYVSKNCVNWNTLHDKVINNYMTLIKNAMNSRDRNLGAFYPATEEAIKETNKQILDLAKSAEFIEVKNLFTDYKNAVIQEEIETLKDMRNNISQDVMNNLKMRAKEQQRLVYALAWGILLYQMVAVLFMYYKRLFAIIILIVIFPIIMAFYVIDKIGDGEAQSLSNWFKEILANMLVQILHAGIYIILINIGIDACNADIDRNWFILILTVCFLFPGERILRGILGLKGATLHELKNNVSGTIVAGVGAYKTAKNVYRGTKSYIKNGGPAGTIQKMKKEIQEEEEKKAEKAAKKKKAKSDLERSKQRARMQRQERIENGAGSRMDRAHEKVDKAGDSIKSGARNIKNNVKRKITGFAPVKAGIKLAEKVKGNEKVQKFAKAAKAVGKGANSLRKGTMKYGKFALKKVGGLTRKGVGLTMGAVEGMESFGKEGPGSAFYTARTVAKDIGGFKDKENVKLLKRKAPPAASMYQSVYQNGSKIDGDKKHTKPGNVNPTTIQYNNRAATKIKSKLEKNTNTEVHTKVNDKRKS